MKKLVLFPLILIVLILGAALVGPTFVDWNKYKPQILEKINATTGYNVAINGDLSLTVLPRPQLSIEGLVIESPKKVKFENLLSLEKTKVAVSALPLLQKKIVVDRVTLVSPDIQLEIMEDGSFSYMTKKLQKADGVVDATPKEVKQKGAAITNAIAFNGLDIENGKFSFYDHRSKKAYNVKDMNLSVDADTLKGPFKLKGDVNYTDKKIDLDIKTGKLPKAGEMLELDSVIGLSDAGAQFKFNGVTSIAKPFEVQGQTNVQVSSPAKLASVMGTKLDGKYNETFKLDGLLSADQSKVSYDNLKISFGDLMGNGRLNVTNLEKKDPLELGGKMEFTSLNLNKFIGGSKDSAAKKKSSGVPQTLTLPMAVNTNIQVDFSDVKYNGNLLKGVFVDLQKKGKSSAVKFKTLEIPGNGKIAGSLNVNYGSRSVASKTGAVTYSDPNVSFVLDGKVGQIEQTLKAFAPNVNAKPLTNLYKSALFDLKGSTSGDEISLKGSTIQLDQTVLGVGGSYKAVGANGRPKAVIELTAGDIDFDNIMQRSGLKKSGSDSASKKSLKQSVAPLQNLSLPMDLTLDVSLQKARINKADLNGLRVAGSLIGNKLNITKASVNNFAGAVINVKGGIGDLRSLSGLDLDVYTKTDNVKNLASALKVDASKLPPSIKALEANVSIKGSTEKSAFSSNIKALSGQLDVSGTASNLLATPSFTGLTVGMSHPNLVKAIQIVSPNFAGSTELAKPVKFSAKASSTGKRYNLTDINAVFGPTSLVGALDINMGGSVPDISGKIQAASIPLDDLLGAKKSGASKSSSDRWSKKAIDLSWMNSMALDLGLSAKQITYGSWNFAQPSTQLKISGGTLNAQNLKAGVFGGNATLNATIKAGASKGAPLSMSVKSDMDSIALESLVRALSGSNKLRSSGTVNFDMDVNASGASSHALVNALGGSAKLRGSNVVIKGFDLPKMAEALGGRDKLRSLASGLVSGAVSGGQTKFDSVNGDYTITNGVVKIDSMKMDSDSAVVDSTGNADLPKWYVDTTHSISLKTVPDMKPLSATIKGPLNRPLNSLGKGVYEDYLQQKFQSQVTDKLQSKLQEELGDKVPDLIGGDVGNALKQFGILPKDKTVEPTPEKPTAPEIKIDEPVKPIAPTTEVPKVEAPAVKEPVAPKVEPKAEPAPKKIEKPEDAVKELLKGAKPEDVLNDALKGLF